MIERLRVRVPAGAAGEFTSPELTFCADTYSVSFPPRVAAVARLLPFYQKCRWQVIPKDAYTLDPTKSEWADCADKTLVWEPSRESSSHAPRQETLGHSRLSSLSHCGLILA